jgi:hypothetical protein
MGNSSDMRAASQHELMRKVPIGWGYDIKTFIGALRPPSTTALDFTPADTWFFRQWRIFPTVEKADEHWSRYCGLFSS